MHRFGDGSELRTALRVGQLRARPARQRDPLRTRRRCSPAALAGHAGHLRRRDTVLHRSRHRRAGQDPGHGHRYLQSDYSGSFGWFGLKHTRAGRRRPRRTTSFDELRLRRCPAGVTLTKPRTTVGTPDDGACVDEALRIVDAQPRLRGRGARRLRAGPGAGRAGVEAAGRPALGPASRATTATYATAAADQRRARCRPPTREPQRLAVEPALRRALPADAAASPSTSPTAPRSTPRATPTSTTRWARTRRPRRAATSSSARKLDCAERQRSRLRLALFHATKYNERNRDEEIGQRRPTTCSRASATRPASSSTSPAASRRPGRSSAPTPGSRTPRSTRRLRAARTLIGEAVGPAPGLTPRTRGTVWTTYQLTPKLARRRRPERAQQRHAAAEPDSRCAPSFVTADLMAEYTTGPVQLQAQPHQRHRRALRRPALPRPLHRRQAAHRAADHGAEVLSSEQAAAMLLHIPEVLTADELRARPRAAGRPRAWGDGRVTAGVQAAQVKNNEQLPPAAPSCARAAGASCSARWSRHALFFSAALPKRVLPPHVQPLRRQRQHLRRPCRPGDPLRARTARSACAPTCRARCSWPTRTTTTAASWSSRTPSARRASSCRPATWCSTPAPACTASSR